MNTQNYNQKRTIMLHLKHIAMICIALIFTGCVQEAHQKIIFVKIDMTGEDTCENAGIRGNFPLSWDETTFLSDNDKDGIYEGEFEIYTANNAIQFKFVNQNNLFELQGQDNRILNFEYKPETILYEATFNNPKANIKKQ